MKTYKLPGYGNAKLTTFPGPRKLMPSVCQMGHCTPIDRNTAALRLRQHREWQRQLRQKSYQVLRASGYSEISPNPSTYTESVREPRNEVRTKGGRLPGGWLRMR